ENLAGKKVRCPGCQAIHTVPATLSGADDQTAVIPPESRPAPPAPATPPTEQIQPTAAPRRQRREEAPPDERDRPERKGPTTTSGKAIASLVLGILSLVCCLNFLTGIPAGILGLLAMRDIGQSGGKVTGKAMAIIGIILGLLGSVIVVTTAVVIVIGMQRAASGLGESIAESADRT